MSEFLSSAWTWIAIGLAVALFVSRDVNKSKADENHKDA